MKFLMVEAQFSPACHVLGKRLLRAQKIKNRKPNRCDYLQINTANQTNKYRWCFQKHNHLMSPCNFVSI